MDPSGPVFEIVGGAQPPDPTGTVITFTLGGT